VMSTAPLPEGLLLLGIADPPAAAAGPTPHLGHSADRAHGGELVAKGLFGSGLRQAGGGGIAVEEADGMLCELAAALGTMLGLGFVMEVVDSSGKPRGKIE